MKTFALFFGIQFLNYAVLTWNFRSIAQARYVHIGISDMCAAAISFTLIKRVAKTDSRTALAGYVLGGAFGSVVTAWATKMLFGQ